MRNTSQALPSYPIMSRCSSVFLKKISASAPTTEPNSSHVLMVSRR